MKKLIAIALVVITVLALCACSAPKEGDGLDPALEAEILTSGVITVATSPDYEPYEFIDADGNFAGFDIELGNALMQWFEGYKIEWVSMSFDTIVSAVSLGTVDAGISCFTFDPDRDVTFSDPYTLSSQIAVVAADSGLTKLDDLFGKTIGLQLGTTGATAAEEYYGDDATFSTQTDYGLLFESLKSNALDAVICDYAVGQNYAASGNGFAVIEEKLIDENMSVIIGKDKTALTEKFNAAIKAFMATDEYAALCDKWGI